MADFEKLQENVDPIMKSVVKNILKNRGVTSDKVRTLSEEEKENIFNMLEVLKKQTDALVQKQKEKAAAPNEKGTKREKNADASSENGERPRRRRNRTNRLREKLRQRREQENTATAENSTESDTSAEKNGDL
ncbi:spore coat protein [Bacillus licheniformis]|uniref:spore coat protein n=1 Tax=Bacillus licheniformis TaxID=1402 RepID=UPI0008CEA48A|nr:spore coat protein [Bacillus licheniformis]MBT1249655.1 spore coat protein [Bacillus licheniformis]MCY9237916.1 spore coat protein [Bacillus licheniformis]MED1524083.1 spore coat protein [Bacillus licheniformis]MED4930160.1 spore coat protein [Bacillus licheniformis]